MTRSSRVALMMRLRMSRPSWSVPAQCAARWAAEAPAARWRRWGRTGTSHGSQERDQHQDHAPCGRHGGNRVGAQGRRRYAGRSRRRRPSRSCGRDPGIGDTIQNIDDDVHRDEDEGHQQHERLHRRVIRGEQRVERVGWRRRARKTPSPPARWRPAWSRRRCRVMVMTGRMALRNAYVMMMRRRGRPMAAAVRMKSAPSTASIEARVMRAERRQHEQRHRAGGQQQLG